MSDGPKLGKLAPPSAFRDAIHVCVVPLRAESDMDPGCHFSVENGYMAHPALRGQGSGYVDPELTQAVKKGQWFWGCLYQGSVESMRHAWTHKDFKTKAAP